MPEKQTLKPLHLFFPITRAQRTDDGKALLVEGYAYVNAIVGDGWNLKRSAMEKATPDYMNWGAIRAMHQPSAVGTATGKATVAKQEIELGVIWDEKGAFIRTIIVDEDAINKVERQVYKGFSVGVRPTVARGKDVEEACWLENSLVDRPYDKDAVITSYSVARADGVDDPNAEFEVDVYGEDEQLPGEEITRTEPTEPEGKDLSTIIIRGVFADKITARENGTKRGLAFEVLSSSLYKIMRDATITDKDAAVRESTGEFADYIAPLIVEYCAANASALPDDIYYGDGIGEEILTRFADVTRAEIEGRGEIARVLAEMETLRTTLTAERDSIASERDVALERGRTLDADLTKANAEIERLGKLPDGAQPRPVRVVPAEREFLANRAAQTQEADHKGEIETLRAEMAELVRTLPKEADEKTRQKGAARISAIKQQIARLGG